MGFFRSVWSSFRNRFRRKDTPHWAPPVAVYEFTEAQQKQIKDIIDRARGLEYLGKYAEGAKLREQLRWIKAKPRDNY